METPVRHIFLCLVILYALAGCSSLGGGLPDWEALLARHLEVAYPDGDISRQPQLSMKGRLLIEDYGVDAPITLKMKAPDKRLFSAQVFGQEVLRGCSDGECWAKELNAPTKRLGGGELAFMQELSDFYRLQHLQRYYRSIRTIGRNTFNDVPAYEVQLIRNNGNEDRWYFAQQSGLWLGGMWQLSKDMGGSRITQVFDAYRRFDGLQIATKITEVAPQQTSLMVINEVSFAPIPDEVFELKE